MAEFLLTIKAVDDLPSLLPFFTSSLHDIKNRHPFRSIGLIFDQQMIRMDLN